MQSVVETSMESDSEHEKETKPTSESDKTKTKSSRMAGNNPQLNPPPPSPWKRLALILFLLFSFLVAFKLRTALFQSKKAKVIYASRYSKEFKFRPAASPIITETLKDGRTRIRGALPDPTTVASPPPPKKNNKKKKTAGSGKRKQGKSKSSK